MSEIIDVSLPSQNEFMQPDSARPKEVLHENWLLNKENLTINETNKVDQNANEQTWLVNTGNKGLP